jgi:hypothetical protein
MFLSLQAKWLLLGNCQITTFAAGFVVTFHFIYAVESAIIIFIANVTSSVFVLSDSLAVSISDHTICCETHVVLPQKLLYHVTSSLLKARKLIYEHLGFRNLLQVPECRTPWRKR